VGADGKHLKLTLEQGGVVWDAIAFRQGGRLTGLPTLLDLAYSVEVNEWEGRRRLQLNVQDLRPAE
jgi:single-stranded-DNA-specific exonuclease